MKIVTKLEEVYQGDFANKKLWRYFNDTWDTLTPAQAQELFEVYKHIIVTWAETQPTERGPSLTRGKLVLAQEFGLADFGVGIVMNINEGFANVIWEKGSRWVRAYHLDTLPQSVAMNVHIWTKEAALARIIGKVIAIDERASGTRGEGAEAIQTFLKEENLSESYLLLEVAKGLADEALRYSSDKTESDRERIIQRWLKE